MPLTIDTFRNVANSAFFTSRDIVVRGADDNATAQLGNRIFSHSAKTNDAAMAAFKSALEREYGVLGTHAFDTVLGARNEMHKSLRARDVTATLSNIENVKRNRYIGEINRQLDTSPKVRALSADMERLVRSLLGKTAKTDDLSLCSTQGDISSAASRSIDAAIQEAKRLVDEKKDLDPAYDIDANPHAIGERMHTDKLSIADTEPTGLMNLKNTFGADESSVQDQIKKGFLGAGMTINRSSTNPVLLEKLKTNGVEPGFIYRNDWSADDTNGFMMDVDSEKSLAALDDLKANNPAFAEKCDGKTVREQILLAGRAHPAAMAAAAELLLEKAAQLVLSAKAQGKDIDEMERVSASVKQLAKAVKNFFHTDEDIAALASLSTRSAKDVLKEAKIDLFSNIRDAVLGVTEDDAEYKLSPVFKHFAERAIVKLDYNEGDKFSGGAGGAGTFRRPERIITTRGAIIGRIYRFQSRASADSISAGAVTEALANDLSRIAGVPSQELTIVRGKYSDGHPKIMLAAKFKDGYKDFERGLIKDGRVIAPDAEKLGKYKAFFLVTADRDGVGKRGQNKGLANGKFFAIDPGHSLEGNGQYLQIADDLSFRDTYKDSHTISFKPRFDNFSVFDDDTRFAKFSGILDLRAKVDSGAFDRLFADYKAAFDPNEQGITDAEKTLRTRIIADIAAKETEFKENVARVLSAGAMQLELFDALDGQPQAVKQGAIENLANLEKLFSPTTWVSKNGQVKLEHLEVIPETRVKWSAGVEGDNIVYHHDGPLDENARGILDTIAQQAGATLDIDAAVETTRLVIPKAVAERFFAAFGEDKVAQLTHPEESAARAGMGGDPLKTAKTYTPNTPVYVYNQTPMATNRIPDELDVEVGRRIVRVPKRLCLETATTPSRTGCPRTEGELRAMMGSRIRRGNEILRALLRGNVSRFEPTPENAAALRTALDIATLGRAEPPPAGALPVDDPDGHVARWLAKVSKP